MESSFASRCKARDVMSEQLVTLAENDQLNLWEKGPTWKKYRHLPVVNGEGKMLGLVSHRDIMNRIAEAILNPESRPNLTDHHRVRAGDVMIREGIVTVGPEDSLKEVAGKLYKSKIGAIPVVDLTGVLLGLITEADFVELVHFGEESYLG